MTKEDKQLLIKDLCGRLPYGVIVSIGNGKYREDKKLWTGLFDDDELWGAKPYLRPMDSMTEEEYAEFGYDTLRYTIQDIDWLNAHHFDYRGLIEKGLALEAHEGMYK